MTGVGPKLTVQNRSKKRQNLHFKCAAESDQNLMPFSAFTRHVFRVEKQASSFVCRGREMLRDAERADWTEILTLNERWVHFLSPMDELRLAGMAKSACFFRVAVADRRVAGFTIAFRKGADYDGVVFQYFERGAEDFIYLDRTVVAAPFHRKGVASALHEAVADYARSVGVSRLTCEIDLDPPNEISLRFHERLGFRQIGSLVRGAKTVSLCERRL